MILRARINAGLVKKQLHDLERRRVRDTFSRFMLPILLSESTRAALLRRPADLRPIGNVEVRGRQSDVVLWTVDGYGSRRAESSDVA